MGSDQQRKIILGLSELMDKQTSAHLERMEKLSTKINEAIEVYEKLLRAEFEEEMESILSSKLEKAISSLQN